MTLKEQALTGLRCHLNVNCYKCPYNFDEYGLVQCSEKCKNALFADIEQLISDMEGTIALLEREQEAKQDG